MNSQIRHLFTLVLVLFGALGLALTYVQFVKAPDLLADSRNTRRYIQASERDRGPIIVADDPVALSVKIPDSATYERSYPYGDLYAPVTGYFSAVNLSATGMEAAENDVLEGETDRLFWSRMQNLIAGKPRQGGGVVLTLDPHIQQEAAAQLEGRVGAIVVLDAKTAAVRALYSSPSYDPNPLASLDADVASDAALALEENPLRPLDNRAIAGNRFAPGSTFKILTAIAMLEDGMTPATLVEAPVTTTLPGTETQISNINMMECGTGEVSLTEAFARSCNTPFVLASEKLKEDALQDVAKRFGFGDKLDIPLRVTPSTFPEEMDAAQMAMSAIGQFDVQVTPMQMAMVTQTIANRGTMMRPYLVDGVVDADNRVRGTSKPHTLHKPIKPHLAQEMTTMMVAAVQEPYGTGQALHFEGLQVAAKTGTAEVGDGSRANGWIVGFAPADDPQIVFSVLLESTDAMPTLGGQDAAQVAKALLEVSVR